MKSEFTVEAVEDFQHLTSEQMAAVREKVEEIEENPTGHEDAKLIRIAGRQLYRVRVREERGAEIDHRLVYDVVDGRIIIYSVFDRDRGYDEELEERIR